MPSRSLLCILFLFLAQSAFSQDGRGLQIDKPAAAQQVSGTTYALIVGISAYQFIPSLNYADSDAIIFKDYVQSTAGGSVKNENMLFLLNDDAKGGTLNSRALAWIENRKYVAGDKLYIYLAGHGDAIDEDEYFFLGSDLSTGNDGAKNNYTAGFTLQMYNLKVRIKRIVAKGVQVVLIIDACRSGELAGGASGQRMFATGIVKNPVGDIMMLSAAAGQSALEDSKIGGGHGLFTWYLLEGLSGEADKDGNGKIDMYELKSYVTDNVRSAALSKFNKQQSPDFLGYTDDSKTIGYVDPIYRVKWNEYKKKQFTNTGGVFVAGSNHKKTEGGIPRQLTVGVDSVLIHTYNLFTSAIKQNRLMGANSAAFYYNSMASSAPGASLTEDAKYTLAGEYMNYAQGKINIYLQGKDMTSENAYAQAASGKDKKNSETNTKYQLVATVPYRLAADMLDSAMLLLHDDPILLADLRPKYLFLRARSYFGSKHGNLSYANAMANVQEAIKLQPNAAYLYNVLGMLLENDKKKDKEALMAYNTAIKMNNRWASPWNNIGVLFHRRKNYDSAEKYYRKALEVDSASKHAWSNLGVIYADRQSYTLAQAYYNKALQIDSTFVFAYNHLGDLFEKQKQYEEAELWYKKGITIDPTHLNMWIDLGNLFYNQGKHDQAEYYYKKAVGVDSTSIYAWLNLGTLSKHQKKYLLAETYFLKARTIDTTDKNIWFQLGSLYRDQEKYVFADSCFKKAIAIDDSYVEAWCAIGRSCLNQQKHFESGYYYTKALSIDSAYSDSWQGLGSVYDALNIYNEAVKCYKKAISADSSNSYAWNNCGVLFFSWGKYEEAEDCFKRALVIMPEDADVLTSLGMLLTTQKKYNAAVVYYEKVMVLNPNKPEPIYNLCCMYSLKNDQPKAIEYLELAIKKGYKYFEDIQKDTDLDTIRSLPEYTAILKKYFPDKF